MNDDSDSSDIECRLQAVQRSKKQKTAASSSRYAAGDCADDSGSGSGSGSDDDDSDDDDFGTSTGAAPTRRSTRRRPSRPPLRHSTSSASFSGSGGDGGGGGDAVTKRLAKMNEAKLVRQRARQNKLNSRHGSDSSDDDDNDDDDSDVENGRGVPPASSSRKQQPSRTSARVVDRNRVQIQMETKTAEAFVLDLVGSSSDDDDDEYDDVGGDTKASSTAAINPALESLRQASASLQSAKRVRSDDIMAAAAAAPVAAAAAAASSHDTAYCYITLTVDSQVHMFAGGDGATTTKTTEHCIGNYHELSVLKAAVLQSLEIKPESCVCTLTHNDKVLLNKKKAPDYDLMDGSRVQATIKLTGLNAFLHESSTSAAASTAAAAGKTGGGSSGTADLGQAVTVTLRRQQDSGKNGDSLTRECRVHLKEPLQALVDRYIAKEKLGAGAGQKICLKFDGEKLVLTKTPSFYGMEDEDQIDVSILQ